MAAHIWYVVGAVGRLESLPPCPQGFAGQEAPPLFTDDAAGEGVPTMQADESDLFGTTSVSVCVCVCVCVHYIWYTLCSHMI